MSELADSGHGRFEGDAAAYALNALGETDVPAFEEHLAACARCQQELAAMRAVVEVLPVTASTRVPSRELRQRVMATVCEEARASREAVDAPTPRARAGGWGPIAALAARLTPRVAVALVAALAIAGVLTLGGGSGSVRTYAGISYATGARASVRESGGRAQLRVSGLPAPPAGRIYQVWLKRGRGEPTPTGALFAISSGSVAVRGSLRGVQALLVTAEPRPNGSSRPTRRPIIIVRLA